MEAGTAVLAERGYFGATVADITRRADVALGTFYRYFDNKDALFIERLEALVEELYESVSGTWTAGRERESLLESSRRYLTTYYANRRLIAAMIEMSGAVPACAEQWWQLRNRTYARKEQYLRSSPSSATLDPGMSAVALGAMVEQFAYHWYIDSERFSQSVPDIELAARTLSTIWYRAVYCEG